MRTAIFFSWLAIITSANGITYPTTIELDVVSPRNDTYNSVGNIPIVFAIQNAKAAFTHGYSLTLMTSTVGKISAWGTGSVRQSQGDLVPPEALNNIWYTGGNLTYFNKTLPIQPGQYNMSIKFSIGSCRDSPGVVTAGITVRQFNVVFTVVGDGSGKNVDLTTECPEFKDTLTIEKLTGPVDSTASCPVTAEIEPEGISNPCRAQMSELMAECVAANLTGVGDASACSTLAQQGRDAAAANGDGANANNDTADVNANNSTANSSADSENISQGNTALRHYGSTFGDAVLAGIVAITCLLVG